MKRVLFVHDHIFKYRGNAYYSGGGLPAAIWPRYLQVFPSLTVVGRDGGTLIEGEEGYTLSSASGVDFCLLPGISNLKSLLLGHAGVEAVCRSLVADSEGVIARLPSRLGHLFVKEAKRQGKPYAVEVVGCAWGSLWDHGSWKGKFLAPIEALKTRQAVASAPFALYVTEKFLQKRYPCKGGVTTFCSNVNIQPVADEVLFARQRRIESHKTKVVIGLIGNYSSKYKGIDVAIRAMALADEKLPEWEFQVVGSGDASAYIDLAHKLGVDEKVKFVGTKPSGSAIYEWLDTVDLYLQPSFQEGLPRALVEAMSRGCPAVATSIAGIPELLKDSEMIAAGDHATLSSKILALLQDNEAMLRLARENFERAQSYYQPVLDTRRTTFWSSFGQYIGSNRNRPINRT
ncbi:glycosyltransferase family 4 protein [Pseudomonas sp. SWRI12]|uniref:Glycosyltransferase family 4 protein n=1 Tax=Pseudomonas zanjanensis TaxID=2745496 RepID=A0A923FAY8_9PSED|nr:glycosyltransferase family 4 protein [Pseudomonas zanjanensis]MBV4494405.1 glycosyltransferase family 4 protein [Pseudomonas zanjanensis]